MEFVIDLFWAMLLAGVPFGLFTLALVWWALRHGLLKEYLDPAALKREMKAMSRNHRKQRKDRKKGKAPKSGQEGQHPLQKKWAKFGGGFYGVAAFFTYIAVEAGDVYATIMKFDGFSEFLKRLDIGLLVNMLVNALTNFVTAMLWPAYWLDRIDTNQPWLWLAAAYGGYWLGLRAAQRLVQRNGAGVRPAAAAIPGRTKADE